MLLEGIFNGDQLQERKRVTGFFNGEFVRGCGRVKLASDDVSMIGFFPTSQIDSSSDLDLSYSSALDCMRSYFRLSGETHIIKHTQKQNLKIFYRKRKTLNYI